MKPSNGQVYNSLVFGRPKILLIAPHNNIAEPFRTALEKHGFAVTVADSSSTQSRLLRTEQFALVVTLWLNGLHHTDEADVFSRTVDALFLLGHQTSDGIVEAFQNGVYRFEAHRTDADKFVKTVRELLEAHYNAQHMLAPEQAKTQNHHKRPTLTGVAFNDLIGQSPQIEEVRQRIMRISQFPGMPVLITGETGTGKEVVANLLHYFSPRADKPLIKVNCSAISEALFESQFFGHRKGAFTGANNTQRGLVEAAKDGTLFLDEISSLKLELQAKLLRLLEDGSYLPIGETIERRINAWIIAVSNENLADLVKKKLFRPDLYYRLKDIVINMPALRDRREDVLPLAEHFLKQFEQDFGMPPKEFSHEARDILQHFPWPGNVRELKRVIHSLSINCPEQQIMVRHLPLEMHAPMSLHEKEEAKSISLDDWEKVHLVEALKQTHCNRSKVAAILRIDRKTLYRKIAKYHIDLGAFRRNS